MDTTLNDLSGSGTRSGSGFRTAPRSTRRRRKVPRTVLSLVQGKREDPPKQATSFISALPEELVMEILSHLPPKPFFRCRSVYKYWLSLSSVAFDCNKHLQLSVSGLFDNYYSGNGCFGAASYVSYGSNKVEW